MKKKLFSANPDEQTGFWRFMTILFAEFFDLIKLNLLFLAVGIAVITIPAAAAGMARVTVHMTNERNHFLTADFFDAFRRKFWRCLGVGATFLLAGAFAALSIVFYATLAAERGAAFYLLAGLAVCILLLEQAAAVCVFPLLGVTDLPYGGLLTAAKEMMARHAGRAFAAAAINVFLFVSSFLLSPGSIIFTVFIEFSFMSFIASYLMVPALRPYLRGEESKGPGAS